MLARVRKSLPDGVASLTLAGLIGAASSFLFWLVAARRAEIEVVGRATTVVLVGSAVNAVTSFGLTIGLLRAKSRSELGLSTVVSAMLLSLLGSVLFSAVVGGLWPSDSLIAHETSRLTLMVELVALSGGLALSVLIDTLASSYGVVRLPIVRNVVVLIARLVAVFACHRLTVGSLVLIFMLPLVASVLLAFPWFMRGVSFPHGTRRGTIAAIRESLTAWPASLVFSAVSMVLPLLVVLVVGPAKGAVFYLLWNIALLCNSLIGAVTSLGLGATDEPTIEMSTRTSSRDRKTIVLVSIATAAGGVGATYVFGRHYVDLGLTAAPFVGLGFLPYGFMQYDVMRLRRDGRHGHAAIATSTVVLVMIMGLVVLRPQSLLVVSLIWCLASVIGTCVSRGRRDFSKPSA